MKPLTLEVHKRCVTELFIGRGGLRQGSWIDLAAPLGKRFALITDHHVRDLLGSAIKAQGEERGLEVHLLSFPPGEASKSRLWKEKIEDQMIELGLGRESAVIALGGGVVTDLAGFVAATYCRGVALLSIPTTLLAMCDACLGGKVGVNTERAKNLIGALHHPRKVLIDIEMLATLPERERLNGLAEVVKYALISSPPLFAKLQGACERWRAQDPALLQELIEASCTIKSEIVQQDPNEMGLRRILNFGHTVGHAIETLSGYQVAHGEAVAIGCAVEGYISYRLGYLTSSESEAIVALLREYNFPLALPPGVDEKGMTQVMKLDKKAHQGEVRLVLLSGIGEAMTFDGAYCHPVTPQLLSEAISWMIAQFGRR